MTREQLENFVAEYFPLAAVLADDRRPIVEFETIVRRLGDIEARPIGVTQANQVLHLAHCAGMSEGFFRYYFLESPALHPYPVTRVDVERPSPLCADGINAFAQLKWGLRRFLMDALLNFGDLRAGYRALRTKDFGQLTDYFASQRFRGNLSGRETPFLPFTIPAPQRHFVGELAQAALKPPAVGAPCSIERALKSRLATWIAEGRALPASVRNLVETLTNDVDGKADLEYVSDDARNRVVSTDAEIKQLVEDEARTATTVNATALANTRLYLSVVNELDVYVATSMRTRAQFQSVAGTCDRVFGPASAVTALQVRYFDPTVSAAANPRDKGLIECLMVKCCKALLYVAGETDSYGKDAEAAMAMSLGKPVVILCPQGAAGKTRAEIFREKHPLSRLIDFRTGVAWGAMVTQDETTAVELLRRVFTNEMEYKLEQAGSGYWMLRESLSNSVVRLATNDALLRETFWNYYHGVA